MKRAALYARVSTGEQNEEMQILEMRERCHTREWQATEFFDHGISGAQENRPALDEMMKQVRRGKFDVVIVYKFDRFARSLRQLVMALEEFNSLKVAFVSVRDDIDTSTPSGRLMFHMIGAFAEFERSCIRERVVSAMELRKSKLKQDGYFISKKGRRCTGLGRPRALVDPAYIRHRRAQGAEWKEIASELKVSRETCRRALINATKGG